MGKNSKIAWTDHTFNPWWGCYKNSPECANCYAEAFASAGPLKIWGQDAPRRFFGENHWKEPLKWNRDAKKCGVRAKVFCASMCDVMEAREDLVASRERLYSLIEETPHLDWLLLTKFPQNFGKFLPQTWLRDPLPNVWGMTTVGCNKSLWRADELMATPFAVRSLSMEPLLEYVDITAYFRRGLACVILGGERGARARPFPVDDARKIMIDCIDEKKPVFMKQFGSFPTIHPCRQHHYDFGGEIGRQARFSALDKLHPSTGRWRIHLDEKAGKDISEWPKYMRLQQYPKGR